MASKALRPIRIEGNDAFITLTKGYVAVIDAADVPLVDGWNWCARVEPHTVYAVASTPGPRGKQKTVILHRVIMGNPVGMTVDHIDGDGLNNRRRGPRGNLRLATVSQNTHNQRRSASNTSGFKGVNWHKANRRWQSQIKLNGKSYKLGYFDTPEDAYAAYCAASIRLHGEFSRLL